MSRLLTSITLAFLILSKCLTSIISLLLSLVIESILLLSTGEVVGVFLK
nr:MAG TPA: hypothetical protein [Crassvirales sp.]